MDESQLKILASQLMGDLKWDALTRNIYATDASVYREIPIAIAFPSGKSDLVTLVKFASEHLLPIIPRGGGTSLAGQVVGKGLIVDVSRYMNRILEFNEEERWVKVEPGIVRDELNHFLKPHGLFFSPITSTANRAVIGGMVGNNSCGTNSIVYGTTRDHTLEIEAILSDGSEVIFSALDVEAVKAKTLQEDLEGELYKQLIRELSDQTVIDNINNEFPGKDIHRRNTGYAVDLLLREGYWDETGTLNLCKMLAGSEGTLALFSSIKLNLDVLPPSKTMVVAAHFETIRDSMIATQVAMQHDPFSCELMDRTILECTRDNLTHRKNRFFVEGDPAAILLVEFRDDSDDGCTVKADDFIKDLKRKGLGYAFPKICNEDTKKVWALRSGGLGLLANLPGDQKAVACIEDTAVSIRDLPDYIDDFTEMMNEYGQKPVYYAHAGAGEIHLRPLINLKDRDDVVKFKQISRETARLVKKYGGSLSGEHGDGRVRAPFIPLVLGEDNYQLLKRIKSTWDPDNLFNPGKIVDALPMDEDLRYEPGREEKTIETVFSYEKEGGVLRAIEKCNGSGDCRKLPLSGGTMCPSYHVTREEQHTTRGRANILREMLTQSTQYNPWDHQELIGAMDLCISCKGCTSECPSNVDMSTLKAEFFHQYYQSRRPGLRTLIFGFHEKINRLASFLPGLYNYLTGSPIFDWISSRIGITNHRSLPKLKKQTLRKWYNSRYEDLKQNFKLDKSVYLFCDEFTNYYDPAIGVKTILLCNQLGYDVRLINHPESARAAFSKGLLNYARKIANHQIDTFKGVITDEELLIGIEPSAILSFKDEYPRIVSPDRVAAAKELAERSMCVEDFLVKIINERIDVLPFKDKKENILIHGHCHQKSLSDINQVAWLLSLPLGYNVEMIASGCCGMAGSFGYEEEHFDISQKIANLTLLPSISEKSGTHKIAASGTSCRHQIKDLSNVEAFHTVELLYDALEWKEQYFNPHEF